MINQRQAGFSLIELLLAMALFSFGLLVIATGFITLFGMYQDGVSSRQTQLAARVSLDRIVQAGRGAIGFAYTNTANPPYGYKGALCISGSSNKIYYIYITPTVHQLYEQDWDPANQTCSIPAPLANRVALTSSDVQVTSFAVAPVVNPLPNPSCALSVPCTLVSDVQVTIHVTNDIGQLDSTGQNCKPNAGLSCNLTTLSTSVSNRKDLL